MSNAKLRCPFCGEEIEIFVCDDEGNIRDEDYELNPWSGLGFIPVHTIKDGVNCPIAHEKGEHLGIYIYDSREELTESFTIER